jgi:hypothetical protein
MVEADDPETKEGVRVLILTCTSSFGSRDEELADLYDVNPGRWMEEEVGVFDV